MTQKNLTIAVGGLALFIVGAFLGRGLAPEVPDMDQYVALSEHEALQAEFER